ncbi:hypothetical protein LS71_000675 [Helicobacter jaachi]|uniref:Calcineurin-like phosphoesterase domain-containing protein n=1 Tax=Helicobacter jaachi TaxID=1677920 RepID=A0A4U8TCA6_9HELI|nr:metallophosphoesterase [Helicobacter jaachi]TLD97304.1 hypothetical protein LS71_000675 [Helicobacter jaachi]
MPWGKSFCSTKPTQCQLTSPARPQRRIKRISLCILLLCACLLTFSALYAPLTERYYIIESPKISAPVNIALLSDLHSGRFYQADILRILRDKKPDIIAMSGDMVDDEADIQGAIAFFKALNDGSLREIPKFYVSGNHEFWSEQIMDIKAMIRAQNVQVLESSMGFVALSLGDNTLLLGGVDDPYVMVYGLDSKPHKLRPKNISKSAFEEAFTKDWIMRSIADLGKPNGEYFSILLSHHPESIALFRALGVNLILSGHTHGGQVRIPFLLNGLYAPNQGLFPTYSGGIYGLDSINVRHTDSVNPTNAATKNSMKIIESSTESSAIFAQNKSSLYEQILLISRGLSLNVLLPRIFNPPEIVFVKLTPQSFPQ